MIMHVKKIVLIIALFLGLLWTSTTLSADPIRGIYIHHGTVENTNYLNYLIKRAKQVGIDTFVVDLVYLSPGYKRNIKLITDSGLRYVVRIVVFDGGGAPWQIRSKNYWEKKYQLAESAIRLGAREIQLDYIRYSSKQPASSNNAKDVLKVIQWFKGKLETQNIPMQIAVFGETSFGESSHIGQNVPLFSPFVDVVCPMLYPSHFEPYKQHAITPYETVHNALVSLKNQFNGAVPFKLIPYIELSNYRYSLSTSERHKYIRAQIKAAKDAHTDGWYAWSANNLYDNLFQVLLNK